ncbi:hypothetical protein [Klebsiella pneumoniae]|uniref:hypothetical protein n=1 Tax=Klebsiella pneumoniae TaxID=573 RepID=UPI0029BFAE43|nr:hypothetical protein [Klebsiella pneumoniae]
MTSKLTRERIELIANFHRVMALPTSHAEIEELARMALAAMEGESHTDDELSNLLWYSQEATCHSDPNYSCEFQRLATPGLVAGIILELQERRKAAMDGEPVAEVLSNRPGNDTSTIDRALPVGTQLYRHAQPVTVVPKSISVRQAISALENAGAVTTIGQAYKMGWNACRAAMLQELKKSAGTEAICRSNENVQAVEVQSLTSINPAPDLVSLQKKAESIIGNYPGIPDCWCRTCRPVVLNDMRFVVCPDCGNKRCPRANDHRNACTGSNEPGQEGSAYPAAPQEVPDGK